MENRLLKQFNEVITSEWPCEKHSEPYENVNHRALFEITYHTCNSVAARNIFMKLSQDEDKGGSQAILYHAKKKTFIKIESNDDALSINLYANDEDTCASLDETIVPKIKARKDNFAAKDKKEQAQILKTCLVMRKLDECGNYVMLKEIARKVYFAIGDARESAAVVPMFMGAEGASLVQLALNKWMSAAQRLPQENPFPDDHVPGLLKNLMQIKKWVLNLISKHLDS